MNNKLKNNCIMYGLFLPGTAFSVILMALLPLKYQKPILEVYSSIAILFNLDRSNGVSFILINAFFVGLVCSLLIFVLHDENDNSDSVPPKHYVSGMFFIWCIILAAYLLS
ncbi:hypothetical protein [Phocoenobacter skyensis]|uniref:Uncharacterized protein n=1 Tax=Phocoenobacter skyensis TaxID=97481 RepID=A0A1H7W8S2_9PAST|nr:hypothetical protein [Pasteurella skyensis]MDP8079164.1 hypothetical protein [Pasteurella skyensis]MDP8085114.1 hypothetical protein [Pasteurella skyensis]MDP8170101.1 hypothetical protein [Pasteurella skyensis]MDP8174283.1 hypothetical protein [Pasteurella skyensis]MDP8184990.1 hypothetical protein [Pasteurella skyensis]